MTDNDLIERLLAECDHWPRTSTLDPLLREAAAALEAAREDACVALVADIRFACGDNGKRMQPELVEFIRELAVDAERYRWLRTMAREQLLNPKMASSEYPDMRTYWRLPTLICSGPVGGFVEFDAAIDQARGKGVAGA